MTALTLLAAGPLTASVDDRTLTGLLLPFDQVGRTNLGRLTASADSDLGLADMVPINTEHAATAVIGRAVQITRGEDGFRASFSILPTRAGDDALGDLSQDALAAGRAERAAGQDPVRGDRARAPGVRARSSRWRGVRHRFGARPTRSAG